MTVWSHRTMKSSEDFRLAASRRVAEGAVAGVEQRPPEAEGQPARDNNNSSSSLLPTTAEAECPADLQLVQRVLSRRVVAALLEVPVVTQLVAAKIQVPAAEDALAAEAVPAPPRVVAPRETPKAPRARAKMTPHRASADTTSSTMC